jgi:hypothetical protein
MGPALGKGIAVMASRPSKSAEAIVAILVPPACREEVVGDLHERYRSRCQYAFEALITVPLVILSRVRRTADPQVVLIQAFALYVSFLCAAWFKDAALLQAQWGLLRLAIPAGITLLVMMLEDAYANPGRRSLLSLVRGPVFGLAFALASQGLFWSGNPGFALPRWILLYGCAMSLLLSCAMRLLFPPVTQQLHGANAPADWLKRADGSSENLKALPAIAAAFLLLLVALHLWKWL